MLGSAILLCFFLGCRGFQKLGSNLVSSKLSMKLHSSGSCNIYACGDSLRSKLGERVHTSILACKQGTLSTTCADTKSIQSCESCMNGQSPAQNLPVAFGSVANYVVDSQGSPVFRIGKQSIHALNLAQNPIASLSLYPQHSIPSTQFNPLLLEDTLLASMTVIGRMHLVGEEDLGILKSAYFVAHCSSNEDHDTDKYIFYKLKACNIHVCDSTVSCESPIWVDMNEFQATSPNKLMLEFSPRLAAFNVEKQKELKNLYQFHFGELANVQELRADLGVDVIVSKVDADGITLRLVNSFNHLEKLPQYKDLKVPFGSRAVTIEDVKSEILKLFQLAWEGKAISGACTQQDKACKAKV